MPLDIRLLDADEQIEFQTFGDVLVTHWHAAGPPTPDDFGAVCRDALALGWEVVGEPVETAIPDECRFATHTREPVARHYLLPMRWVGDD